jgi:hypothetical protein
VNKQKFQKVGKAPTFACQSSNLAAVLMEKRNPSLKVTFRNCQYSQGFAENFCISFIAELVWMVMLFMIKKERKKEKNLKINHPQDIRSTELSLLLSYLPVLLLSA